MFPVSPLTLANLWLYFCISQYDWFVSFLFSNAKYSHLTKLTMKGGVSTWKALFRRQFGACSPPVCSVYWYNGEAAVCLIMLLGTFGAFRWEGKDEEWILTHMETQCELHMSWISWSLNWDVSHTSDFVWHIAVQLWEPKPLQTDSLHTISVANAHS